MKKIKSRNWMPIMYATFYGRMKKIAKKYGYALAIHGSLTRDMDLVAIPWVEKPKNHLKMLNEICDYIGGYKENGKPYDTEEEKPHGRVGYTIQTGGGGYLDISVILINKKI